MKSKSTYNPAVDLVRGLAILAVVMIHTSTRTLEASKFDLRGLPWTLFLNQASRFAVPLFFMISGFVLELNYPEGIDLGVYLKKRFNKIFVPYVFWSGIYYIFIYHQSASFASILVWGSASYQLYFIPALIVFYLLFPIFHRLYGLIANAGFLVLTGGAEMVFLFHTYFVQPYNIVYPLAIALLNYYVFLVGMVAAHHKEKIINLIRRGRGVIGMATLGLAGYVWWEGRTRYLQSHDYLAFYTQWRPSILLYTLAIGGLAFGVFSEMGFLDRLGKGMARLSFFVFFVHVIVLETLWQRIGVGLMAGTGGWIIRQGWFDPIFFGSTAGLSFVIAYLGHKIPYLSRLTG